MSRRHSIAMAAAWALVALPASSTPPPASQREIGQLLAYLETSGCEFQRSGKWHDARAAREHIEAKYQYLLQRDMVQSTEGFIADAATASSMGGGAYMVRCNGVTQPSGDWLRAELARLRKQAATASKK